MEKLIQILLTLIEKVPWHTEQEKADAIELVRSAAGDVGADAEVVPPAAVDANGPVAEQPKPDPGPVAEPVPPNEQTPPPTSPEVAVGDVENTNAFSQPAADDVPGSP